MPKKPARKKAPRGALPPLDYNDLIEKIRARLERDGYELTDWSAWEEPEKLKGSKIWLQHRYHVTFESGYDLDAVPDMLEAFRLVLGRYYRGRTSLMVDLYSERDDSLHPYSLGITESFPTVFTQAPGYIEDWLIPGKSGDKSTVLGIWANCTPPHSYESSEYSGFEPVERVRARRQNVKERRARARKARR